MSIKKLFSRPEWPALAILLLAAALRLCWLDLKPPHFDEGVNGLFIDRMASTGFYQYDPANYHGPLHFYALFFSQSLLGRNLWAVRLPVALLSILAVGLTLAFGRFIGKNAARWAALAMAVSPAAVFYGRYAIHETWLLVALLMIGLGLGGLWKSGRRRSLWLVVGGVVVAVLTKETYVVHLACFLLAAAALRLVETVSPSAPAIWVGPRWRWGEFAAVVATGLVTIVTFYAGFGLNPGGVKGLWETFALWADTGREGQGHEKEWYYWLTLFARYEWPALLGLVAGAALLWPRSPRFLRYLAIVGAGTLTAYSIIPYKTPWCVLVLLWPFFLVFGWGVERVERLGRQWIVHLLVSLILLGELAHTIRLNFFRYDIDAEPYVYVQTFREINRFTGPVLALVGRDPTAYAMRGLIMLGDYHPLPWVLGDFTGVGYYPNPDKVVDPEAGFMLVEQAAAPDFEQRLRHSYFREEFHLRSGQKPAVIYFDARRFAPFFPGRVPEVNPAP